MMQRIQLLNGNNLSTLSITITIWALSVMMFSFVMVSAALNDMMMSFMSIVQAFVFVAPLLFLHLISIKNRDNMKQICMMNNYLKIFHEIPSYLNSQYENQF